MTSPLRPIAQCAALAAFLAWLLLDRFVIFRGRGYSLAQMKLFGLGANTMAALTMAWAWWTGCLLR